MDLTVSPLVAEAVRVVYKEKEEKGGAFLQRAKNKFLSPPANTGLPPAKRAVQNEEFLVLSSLPRKENS